jgi:hypothetical protein
VDNDGTINLKHKFSFRKHKKVTGLAGIASGHQPESIRLGGMKVGQIAAPNRFSSDEDNWRVDLIVEQTPTEEEPCPWKWVRLKAKFPKAGGTEPVRAWIREHEQTLKEKFQLATCGKDDLE